MEVWIARKSYCVYVSDYRLEFEMQLLRWGRESGICGCTDGDRFVYALIENHLHHIKSGNYARSKLFSVVLSVTCDRCVVLESYLVSSLAQTQWKELDSSCLPPRWRPDRIMPGCIKPHRIAGCIASFVSPTLSPSPSQPNFLCDHFDPLTHLPQPTKCPTLSP